MTPEQIECAFVHLNEGVDGRWANVTINTGHGIEGYVWSPWHKFSTDGRRLHDVKLLRIDETAGSERSHFINYENIVVISSENMKDNG